MPTLFIDIAYVKHTCTHFTFMSEGLILLSPQRYHFAVRVGVMIFD